MGHPTVSSLPKEPTAAPKTRSSPERHLSNAEPRKAIPGSKYLKPPRCKSRYPISTFQKISIHIYHVYTYLYISIQIYKYLYISLVQNIEVFKYPSQIDRTSSALTSCPLDPTESEDSFFRNLTR